MHEVIHENGRYFVIKARVGWEVYRNGITHAERMATMGSDGDMWKARAISQCDRMANAEKSHKKTA